MYEEPYIVPPDVTTEVVIECSDCGETMFSGGDYLCFQCRTLLDESHEKEIQAKHDDWYANGRWEEMRKEAMLSGYQQAINR